jgi:pimeloyl-ACP methyl ester carboxylesterase
MSALTRLVLAATALAMTTGCVLSDLWKVRETEKKAAQYAYVEGTVAAQAPSEHWMLVFVVRVPCDEDWRQVRKLVDRGVLASPPKTWPHELRERVERIRAKAVLVDHVALQRPGSWYTRVAPGCYGVGAYEDVNQDYNYDDEPAAAAVADPKRIFELAAGERRENVEIVIPPDGRLLAEEADSVAMQVRKLKARSHEDQLLVSIDEVTVEGEVADLDDPRFGEENGKLGYWDTYTFLWKVRPGIFFLEPYDPDKIPVLFVHGALGFPQEFKPLVEGLDRTRFQPWVFFYPSGAYLDRISDFLSQSLSRLQLRHGFTRLAVVAHSMGGLVSRSFILKHHERVRDDPVRLFVSISSPWGGVASAEKGVKRSPIVVPSWNDVAPDSEFLASLFFEDPAARTTRRHLPDQVHYVLLFGVEDHTISLPSAVRWEAVRDAEERWPLPYDHTGILRSAEASTLLREILNRENW